MPAFATASENGCRDSNMLYSINTANTSATLTIDGGSSLSAVSVKGKSGVTKICISMTLQKKSGRNWKNVKTWSDNKNAQFFSFSRTKDVGRGSYRVKGVATVYKGKIYETIATYSGTVKY